MQIVFSRVSVRECEGEHSLNVLPGLHPFSSSNTARKQQRMKRRQQQKPSSDYRDNECFLTINKNVEVVFKCKEAFLLMLLLATHLSASYLLLKPFMNPHSLLNKIQTLRVSSKVPYDLASEILSRQIPLPS